MKKLKSVKCWMKRMNDIFICVVTFTQWKYKLKKKQFIWLNVATYIIHYTYKRWLGYPTSSLIVSLTNIKFICFNDILITNKSLFCIQNKMYQWLCGLPGRYPVLCCSWVSHSVVCARACISLHARASVCLSFGRVVAVK